MSEPYSLCVVLRVKPEHAEEFAALVQENVAETRQDQGADGQALVMASTKVGAVILARAVDDETLSEALCEAALKNYAQTDRE